MTTQKEKLPFFRSIRGKLLLAFLGLAVIPLVIVSIMAYDQAQDALKQAAYDKLWAVQTIKKMQVEEYFVQRQGDMVALVETVDSLHQEAFAKLAAVQSIKKGQIEQFFSEQWGAVDILADSSDVIEMYGAFSVYHEEADVSPSASFSIDTVEYFSITVPYEEFLAGYVETYGYSDLLFICADHGHVMYTVAGESDLGANLSSSAWRDSSLAGLWREVRSSERMTIVDFEPYVPSDGALTSFVGTPVHDLDGQLMGVIALQIVIDPINAIAQESTGMGETGETFLVAQEPDGQITLRSDRRVAGDGEGVVGYDITATAPQYVRDALNGEMGEDIFVESDGTAIVSYEPLDIEGLNWAIISKIDVEEALIPQVEGRHRDFFTQYKELYGYHDLFLITSDGYVFYTVVQKPDYQTNLLNGPYAESNLGQLVEQVLETGQFGFKDFDSYAPSDGAVAAFMAQPVTREQEEGDLIEIVVAVQLPLEGINSIMKERAGLQDSGETYLVGPYKRMRSDSTLHPETHSVALSFAGTVEENGVNTVASQKGLEGKGRVGVINNYQDQQVVSAWAPVDVPGLNWVIIAEESTSDAFAAANNLGTTLILITGGLLLVVIIVTVLVASTISRPVAQITDVAQSIAEGNLEVQAEVRAKDETSVLAGAFNQMVLRLRDMLHNEHNQREHLESTVREYVEYMEAVGQGDLTLQMDIDGNGTQNDMLSVLGHTLNRTTATVKDMTRQIHGAASNLTSSAAEILSATTQQASGASEQSAAISQTTTTVDELKTIAEQSVARAQDVASASQRTVEVSHTGQRSVQEIIASMREIKAQVEGIAENILALSEQTQQIGDIISTVNDIASQSNILALNASVEAARAGAYGKGFAVVAVEVRNLAEQSRQATAQVRTILSDIQKATNATVMATEEGTKGVDKGVRLTEQAGEAIVQLAGVIQESAQAAAQMVAGGRQQSAGVEQVALAMQNINQTTVQSLSSTRQAEKAARELNDLARSLTEIVEQYRL
ncbi:MAG: HAMP domain-containing protein [Chloroflexi bacterium]|nr:HAMP domain-containing protein [Chloroflexota bacterium]